MKVRIIDPKETADSYFLEPSTLSKSIKTVFTYKPIDESFK